MARVTDVATATFSEQVLASPIPVVVDVYANWCGPCRALAPLLETYAGLYASEVKFVKVDIDGSTEIAEYFGVSAVPTLLFFRDGRAVGRLDGLPRTETVLTALDDLARRTGNRRLSERAR